MESTAQPTGSIWQNGVFRKMFAAYTMATFGDWLDMLAIMVLIGYVWQAEPVVIALVPVMYALPGVLLGSFAGVIADRWKKVNLMMIADVVAAVLTVGLLFAPSVFWALLLVLLRAFCGVFKIPAHQALTRQVVREDQILQATSMNGIVSQVTKVVGPLLGASLLAVFTPQICISINAVMLFISALILFTMRSNSVNQVSVQEHVAQGSFREDWKVGLLIIVKSRVLFSSLLFTFIGMLVMVLVDSQFLVIMRQYDPENSSLLGWVLSAAGAGAVTSIMLISRAKDIKYGWTLGGGYLLIGCGMGSLGFLEPGMTILLPIAGAFLGGFGFGMSMVAGNFILQKETPADAVGRVFGVQNSITNVTVIVGPPLGGWLVQLMGANTTFLAVSSVSVIVGLIGVLGQKMIWPSQPNYQTGQENVSM